jgi:hypothetical protein
VLLGDRQHGDRRGQRRRADGDVGAVVLISLSERAFGEVRLALVVLNDDDDLAPVDFHRPLSGVFEAKLKTCLGLLGVGLQGTGQPVDEGDLEGVGARAPGGGDERRGEGQASDTKARERSSRPQAGRAGHPPRRPVSGRPPTLAADRLREQGADGKGFARGESAMLAPGDRRPYKARSTALGAAMSECSAAW